MKNEVNRALVAKKKLTILFALLTLSVGLWAEGSVITYTATEKLNITNETFGSSVVTHDWDEATKKGMVTFNDEVWQIEESVFMNCSTLISIDLPASITEIRKWAFCGCNALQSINLSNVTTIGELAFADCNTLQSIDLSNATTIGRAAFNGCESLTSITLSEKLTEIEESVFSSCYALETITLPTTLTKIGRSAFHECTKLKTIIIPASVTTIGMLAFSYFRDLQSITCEGTTPPACDGSLFYYDEGGHKDSPASITLNVPAGSIEAYKAAEGWKEFTNIQETVSQETVSYLYPEYNDPADVTKGIKEWKTGSADAVEITSSSDQVTWTAGWYVVKGTNVQLAKGAICSGAVHLILADGAKLTTTGETDRAGIQVSGEYEEDEKDGPSLTIYGQTAQSGQLEANGGDYAAGIGGGFLGVGSNITINGGIITANGGKQAAGIGGGCSGSGSNITINGGTIEATGGYYAAGIGGGNNAPGSNITINGGNITANGGEQAAGIGGGNQGNGSYITITGGNVTANGGFAAAGIGGGNNDGISGGNGTYITITGGTVTATGGYDAAGIGGGLNGNGSYITINGGTVTANGGDAAAGIGGGYNGGQGGGNGTDITITGGTVTANGGEDASGIGSGYNSGTASNIFVATSLTILSDNNNPPTTEIAPTRTDDTDIANALADKQYAIIGAGTLVPYIDEKGKEQIATNVTEITSSDDQVTWNAGWYVVKGADVQLAKGAVCSGAVHLILADGAKLTATGETNKAGIQVSGDGNSLTIYGQTNQSGQLIATGGNSGAGIGGGDGQDGSNITILGGNITANGGQFAAGIGGGWHGSSSNIFVATSLVVKAGESTSLLNTNIVEHTTTDDISGSLYGKQYVTIEKIVVKITLTAADLVISNNSAIYDGEIKKVEVSMASESMIMPSADNITVYYSNDKTLKQPVNAGTYPVYIDIKGDPNYNDVEGLTDEAWTLTIAKADPTADLFTYTAPEGDAYYDGNTREANVEFDGQDKFTGMGAVTIKYNGETEAPVAGGEYTVSIDVAAGANYNAATGLTKEDWKFNISKHTIEVKPDNFNISNDYVFYDGEVHYATVALKEEFAGAGAVTVTYKIGNTVVDEPINVNMYNIYVAIAESDGYEAVSEATKLGNQNLQITRAIPTAEMFTVTLPENLVYVDYGEGHFKTATATFNDQNGKLTGMGKISVDYKDVNTGAEIGSVYKVGTYQVYLSITLGDNYAERLLDDKVTSEAWQFSIVEAPATFTLTNKTAGQYATICLPQPIASVSNAVLYKISYGDVYEVHFVEETNYAADPAGTPYLVQAINDGDIVFTMTNATPVTDPVGVEAANGFVASLKDEMQDVPVGYEYLLVSGGQLHSAGPGCLLSKNHAYIDVRYVPETEQVAPASGAPRRVTLYNAEVQSPTGNPSLHHSNNSSLKMIKDGQLMIVRDGRMYTIMGVEGTKN